MTLPPVLQRLKVPVIGAPMFIAGKPRLVIEQCSVDVVAQPAAMLAEAREGMRSLLEKRKPRWQ